MSDYSTGYNLGNQVASLVVACLLLVANVVAVFALRAAFLRIDRLANRRENPAVWLLAFPGLGGVALLFYMRAQLKHLRSDGERLGIETARGHVGLATLGLALGLAAGYVFFAFAFADLGGDALPYALLPISAFPALFWLPRVRRDTAAILAVHEGKQT